MSSALLKSAKDYKRYKRRPGFIPRLLRRYSAMRYLFWSILTGSDINPNASLGRGLRLPHPNGVVIHGNAVIGEDCLIMQQVTIGQLAEGSAPVIGSRVYIGAGAKILGKVSVGDGARIGANAVVLIDVPADWTAVGVPAKLLAPKSARSSNLEASRETARSRSNL